MKKCFICPLFRARRLPRMGQCFCVTEQMNSPTLIQWWWIKVAFEFKILIPQCNTVSHFVVTSTAERVNNIVTLSHKNNSPLGGCGSTVLPQNDMPKIELRMQDWRSLGDINRGTSQSTNQTSLHWWAEIKAATPGCSGSCTRRLPVREIFVLVMRPAGSSR